MHDIDGIRGKAAQVLTALCLFTNSNKALIPLESSELILRAERSIIEYVDKISNKCKIIHELDMPFSHYVFMDNALKNLQ
jgi:predicted house-cleaning NTP pyrophosphatase (Maf/HAM1 superfamily)